jgi:WD40 repeat protein
VHGVVYVRVAGKPEGTEPGKDDVSNLRVFVSARMVQGYPAGKTPLSDPPDVPAEQRTLRVRSVVSVAAVSALVLPVIGLAGPISPSTLASRFAEGTPHEGYIAADRFPHVIRFVGRTLGTLSGRQGSIVSAVFSADGRLVATWGWDNVLTVWDCASGALVAKLAGHQDGITQAAFNADGSKVASASHDGTVRVWDIERASDAQVLRGNSGAVLSVAFSHDGSHVVSGGADRTVRIWTTDGVRTATHEGHAGEVTAVTFSPDGRRVASGSSDRTIRIWDPATGQSTSELRGHTAEVTALDFSADGSTLASGSADGTVKLWEARRGGHFVFPDPEAAGRRVYGFVDLHAGLGRVVTDAEGNDLQWWSLDAPERFARLAASAGTARTTLSQNIRTNIIALAPNGREVVAGSTDGFVRRWSVDTATRLPDIAGLKSGITGLAFTPDGSRIALISSAQSLITIQPLSGGKAIAIRTRPEMWSNPRFSADGRLLAAHTDRVVAIWDAESGALARETPPQPEQITSIALSPDGRLVVAGSTVGTIRVWDIASGAAVATLAADAPGFSWPLAFDRAGERLVAGYSGGSDGRVRVWDTASFDVLLQFHIGNHVPSRSAFTPDGRTLLVLAGDGTVARFDARTTEDVQPRQTVDPEALNADAAALARSPRQRPEDYQRAVRLARAALLEVPQSAYYCDTLGMALYRVGLYREAIASFKRAESLRGGPDLPGLFFLALAHDRLGEGAQAQEVANTIAAYAKSRAWVAWSTYEEGWWQELREAAKESTTKKKPPQR